MGMLISNAFSGRDLQNAKTLLIEARRHGLDIDGLIGLLTSKIGPAQQTEQRGICPSCGRAFLHRERGEAGDLLPIWSCYKCWYSKYEDVP